MNQLQIWANGNAARDYSIIYITFTNFNAGTNTRDYPVVRIKNGSTLLWPVTVSTDRPMYIWGNFNTVGWQPASFIADAIIFQSSAWTDAAHPLTGRTVAGGGADWLNPAQSRPPTT